jgi:serine/threonine protein kinase
MQPPREQPDLNLNELMAGIIDGLCEAHQANIFHRDIKPANILLNYDEDAAAPTPLIADFGLSRTDHISAKSSVVSSVSSRQVIVGTQMYLPPEASSHGGTNPAQQDVFAVGVTWYQLLVSKLERPPYDFHDKLRELGVDTRTIKLLSRCLAQPARRYRDAMELKEACENVEPDRRWVVPDGCFDVEPLARAMFERVATAS